MKIRTFLQAFWRTFTSVEYYVDVLNAKLGFSIRFFLMSYVLLGIFSAVLFYFFDTPRLLQHLDTDFAHIQQNYPSDLKINWDGQKLSLTPTQVLSLPYPTAFPFPTDTFPSTFAVIDPQVSQPNKESFVFINDKKIFLSEGAGQWSDFPLNNFPQFDKPFSITKDSLPNQMTTWKTAAQESMTFFALIYPIFFIPITIIGNLFSVLIYSAIAFYILRFTANRLAYWKIFQVALHISVAAETVNILITHFLPQNELPMYALAFWSYFLLIMWQLNKMGLSTKKRTK